MQFQILAWNHHWVSKQTAVPRFQYIWILSLAILLTACGDVRKISYFPNQNDTILSAVPLAPEPLIHENDILSITVSSLSPEASAIFNAANLQATTGSANSSSTLGQQNGYLVGTNGYILFPFLGQIQAAGLTKEKLSANITKSILDRKLLLDPIVSIRQLNFHVTVVGEVSRPGVITVPSEKINIIEAIGQAGDLTTFANRTNVALIREENGQRLFHRINLNSSEILHSPYYYLKSNDIVYAEPNKTKAINSTNQNQLIGFGLTFISILVSVALFFR